MPIEVPSRESDELAGWIAARMSRLRETEAQILPPTSDTDDDPLAELDAIALSMDTRGTLEAFESTLHLDRAAARAVGGAARRSRAAAERRRVADAQSVGEVVTMMGMLMAASHADRNGASGSKGAGIRDVTAVFLDALGNLNDPAELEENARILEAEFGRVLRDLHREQENLAEIAGRTYGSLESVRLAYQALDDSDLDAFYATTSARASLCAMAIDVIRSDSTEGLAERVEVILENRRSLEIARDSGLERCVRGDISLPHLQFEQLVAGLSRVKERQRDQLTRLGIAFSEQMKRTDRVLEQAEADIVGLGRDHHRVQQRLRRALDTHGELRRQITLDIGATGAAAALRMGNIFKNEDSSTSGRLMNAGRGVAAGQDWFEISGDVDSLRVLQRVVSAHEVAIISALDFNTEILISITEDLVAIRRLIDERWLQTALAVRAHVGELEAEQMNWLMPHWYPPDVAAGPPRTEL